MWTEFECFQTFSWREAQIWEQILSLTVAEARAASFVFFYFVFYFRQSPNLQAKCFSRIWYVIISLRFVFVQHNMSSQNLINMIKILLAFLSDSPIAALPHFSAQQQQANTILLLSVLVVTRRDFVSC